ncbi:cytochrome c oxidase assembly factor Coa1 family protein [Corallococcus llansteffanensis]|uniref:Cytochrome oxidase complex assembly protein 1 n=1 Tax=Corallococcus llansteffanensis TaxID=2316731 RepID=A0A3A8PG95_9BACT|nr:cytochrome c oxidase assembly factor Coa1 family protein [Corallococcus llansteffanensis]RKH55368.1 hypothetical protein D7V93_23065 [Corallococcus llansteffanensis]
MPTMPEGDYAPAPRQGWWSRNWKWVAPVGCLGLMGSCVGMVALAIGWGYSSVKDMGAYTEALALAQDDPHVQKALGTPFKPGFPSNTQVSTANGLTHAELVVPLDGPKADGTLNVVADKRGEDWAFRTLYVQLDDGGRIDLLDTGDSGAAGAQDAPPALPDDAPKEPRDEPGDLEPEAPAVPLPPAEKQPGKGSDIEL